MVKFKFLALLPADHLADRTVSSLVLFLRKLAAFAYYVMDGFISVTALYTFAILLRLIYSHFGMIVSYNVVLCRYGEKFCFSL